MCRLRSAFDLAARGFGSRSYDSSRPLCELGDSRAAFDLVFGFADVFEREPRLAPRGDARLRFRFLLCERAVCSLLAAWARRREASASQLEIDAESAGFVFLAWNALQECMHPISSGGRVEKMTT